MRLGFPCIQFTSLHNGSRGYIELAWNLPPGVKNSECHLRFELFSGEHKVQLTERITLSVRRERRRLQVVGIDIGIEFESRSSPTAALPLAFDRVPLD